MKRYAFLSLLLIFVVGACERHDFEDTKKLHEPHGSHGDDHGDHDEKH